MTLQNRVLPTGEIVAEAWYGDWMGNRGILHDAQQSLGRARWTHRNWITCQLNFKGRDREVMRAGPFYTELFFFDEASALAAGHRPCAECRRADYTAFRDAWCAAHGQRPGAAEMDRRLHEDRVDSRTRTQKRWRENASALPSGAVILIEERPALIRDGKAHLWTAHGYREAQDLPAGDVTVCTPQVTVAVLKAGYRPTPHRSLSC